MPNTNPGHGDAAVNKTVSGRVDAALFHGGRQKNEYEYESTTYSMHMVMSAGEKQNKAG